MSSARDTIRRSTLIGEMVRRTTAPVFVVGCARSGTTLLYHMLLSAGGFAVFRAESHVYDAIAPRFGGLRSRGARRRAILAWLRSRHFAISGLNADAVRRRVERECGGAGDFLRIIMEGIAEQQGVQRWADCTPDHLLYVPQIKHQIPDALILHIVRDGRDVALSLERQGWLRALPGDPTPRRLIAAMYWNWMVRKGRAYGRRICADYMEVRFEDLVRHPESVLEGIGRFIAQPLDFEKVRRVGIGSVRQPNTSFSGGGVEFDPVQRWRRLPPRELRSLDAVLRPTLQELGFAPSGVKAWPTTTLALRTAQLVYHSFFATKLLLKKYTPLGRALTGLAALDD